MRLAPKTRIEFKEEMKENFDNIFQKQNVELSGLYLNQLKDQKYIIKKSNKTWPSSELNKEEVALGKVKTKKIKTFVFFFPFFIF